MNFGSGLRLILLFTILIFFGDATYAGDCQYYAPGNLMPRTGEGANDATNYAPGIQFPLKDGLGTTKSALFNKGGSIGGDQCDPANFDNINRDTFCEKRSGTIRESLNCPRQDIHQGIDINGGTSVTCRALVGAARKIKKGESPTLANVVPIVAVDNGSISQIGKYTVDFRVGVRKYRYLHMNMRALPVRAGQSVRRGEIIGFMFNDFGGTPTKFHLHLELLAVVNGAWRHVSPYPTYIASQEAMTGKPCKLIR